jgi:hypothetical protein
MTQKFDFTVNGQPVSVSLDNEETPLLNVLRNDLGLMGTRFGCGLEQCGCCTVLIDGSPEKSCARPIWNVAGKHVTTIEGLGNPEHPHPLQPASSFQPRHCSSAIPHRRARRSPKRSTAISAVAARITASCARWKKPRQRSAREPSHERASAWPA